MARRDVMLGQIGLDPATYIVTDGQMKITVDSEVFDAGTGDIIVAPVGSRRELQGQATLVIINTPKFDPADEQ